MRLPRGDLVRSRVAGDPGEALRLALERCLTGYAVLEPGESMLLDRDRRGVLTFRDGVPVLAYCDRTDRGGSPALADLAGPGPVNVDLYELPADALAEPHEADELRVAPGEPAIELADDRALAERTRERAPDDAAPGTQESAVAAFLADEDRVASIQAEARAEAKRRAEEWGLADQLADDAGGGVAGDDGHEAGGDSPTDGD